MSVMGLIDVVAVRWWMVVNGVGEWVMVFR
jgi:hypothetical protein